MSEKDIMDNSESMINKAFALLSRCRELIAYLIFGLLTTAVNYLTYILLMELFTGKYANTGATGAAWVISVLFAYFTNRKWVFPSAASGFDEKLRECAAFFSARLLSGLIDITIMYAAVDLLGYNGRLIKLLSNVIIVIINYVFSKFFVFKPKETPSGK